MAFRARRERKRQAVFPVREADDAISRSRAAIER